MVFTSAITRQMAHKCNYRLLTEKFLTTELYFNSFLNNFVTISTTGKKVFMNMEVRLRLRAAVTQSLTEASALIILKFRREAERQLHLPFH